MKAEKSTTGKFILSESGGGLSNRGGSRIICGSSGEKLPALFIPKGYANGDHAWFHLKPGMVVIEAGRSRGGESVEVCTVTAIADNGDVTLKKIGYLENGDGNIPKRFDAAVKAALDKASCYHCREPHFAA